MSLSKTYLNRIKIKDLIASIKKDIEPNSSLRLRLIETFDSMEKDAIAEATDEDLAKIEKLFIKRKLDIEYYPSQKKKVIHVNDRQKIVPIDYEYGSEHS